MKKILLLNVFFYTLIAFGFSQEKKETVNSTQVQSQPNVEITYKTPQKVDPVLLQIKELADGDEIITEKVMYEIYKTRNSRITSIISDEKFKQLSKDEQKDLLKKSDIIRIINQLKEQK